MKRQLIVRVEKAFWKYELEPTPPFRISAGDAGVKLQEPQCNKEYYAAGETITLTESGRDIASGWPVYQAAGKHLPLTGYELHGLKIAEALTEL